MEGFWYAVATVIIIALIASVIIVVGVVDAFSGTGNGGGFTALVSLSIGFCLFWYWLEFIFEYRNNIDGSKILKATDN